MVAAVARHWADVMETDDEDVPCNDVEEVTDDKLLELGLITPLSYRLISRITGLATMFCKNYFKSTLITPDQPIYKDIETYFTNGLGAQKLKMTKVFSIQRHHEFLYEEGDNVKLLWHGTTTENLSSILSLGFCTPDRANRQLFGGGVYFADRVVKSVGYCKPRPNLVGSKRYLLLCSVNLGNMHISNKSLQNITRAPVGYDSVMAPGQRVPDPTEECIFQKRVKVPCGKTITQTPSGAFLTAAGSAQGPVYANMLTSSSSTNPQFGCFGYNEYIVYDIGRIHINFLVEYEFEKKEMPFCLQTSVVNVNKMVK